MITKKLMHNIITFCNNYINNDNIVISITKFANYLNVDFNVWALDKYKYIDKCIGSIGKSIHNEEEFIKFKQTILEELPKLLERLK